VPPYVIRQGDHLAFLAHKFGFNADAVWNHPSNADLKNLRQAPNILWPTDILHIPDDLVTEPETHSLVMGQTNTFVSSAVPTVTVTIQFTDPSLASQAFTVPELSDLSPNPTGADGTATFDVPVTQRSFTIVFTASGVAFAFNVGYLDPVKTLSGVFQRLQNLGYIDRGTGGTQNIDIDKVREALRAFKGSQPSASSSSPPASASGDSRAIPYNAGLDDNGALDDDTCKRLVSAHGS
jgi:hypothetical protein